jgi:hypothetical protein
LSGYSLGFAMGQLGSSVGLNMIENVGTFPFIPPQRLSHTTMRSPTHSSTSEPSTRSGSLSGLVSSPWSSSPKAHGTLLVRARFRRLNNLSRRYTAAFRATTLSVNTLLWRAKLTTPTRSLSASTREHEFWRFSGASIWFVFPGWPQGEHCADQCTST